MKQTILLLIVALMLLAAPAVVQATEPLGANVSQIGSASRFVASNTSTAINATAGNVTELLITADMITRHWQGFYGNVTGNIVLGNAAGNSLYTWPGGTVTGEIFAARNGTGISWAGVGCANFSQVENEDAFVNASSKVDTDSINYTFNYTTHPSFSIGTRSVSGCRSTPVNGTTQTSAGFWNALLVDNQTGIMEDDIIIYTAIIDSRKLGFNGNTYDFQMLVGENGNGTEQFPNGVPTTYYFYVELN